MIHRMMSTMGAMATVAAAGLAFIPAAHADALYKTDRAYCMSGEASEARDICMKEAAAAQAERQSGSHATASVHRKSSSKHNTVGTPEKQASAPS